MTRFSGFGEAGFAFLTELEANNSKAVFDAHRAVYEEALVLPAKAFVAELGDELRQRVSPGVRSEPKVGGSLFRINNDLRFARGKPPYKTTLDMVFWEGSDARADPSLLLRLTPTEVHLGAGVFALRGPRLERYRAALLDDDRVEELAAAVDALTTAGADLSEPTRRRSPAGLPAEGPAACFAVRDGFHITRRFGRPAASRSSRFVGWCADRFEPFGPIQRWLVRALDGR